jgi:hypothetical protein
MNQLFPSFLALLSAALLLPACGEEGPAVSRGAISYTLMDTNRNGVADALDLNANRVADLRFGRDCAKPLIDGDGDGEPDGLDLDCDGQIDLAWCDQPLVDRDGDGAPDGLDFDCDGAADVDLDLPEVCIPQLIDDNDDHLPEGIDTDCDGAADVELDLCVPALIDATPGDHVPDGVDLDCDGLLDLAFPQLPPPRR